MGFHDIRIPTKYSAGSMFGPGFRTKIHELDSLAEHRVQRGPAAGRRSYALQRGIDNLDDLYELYVFFLARQGALHSFRLKDWLDYATTTTGSTHRPNDPAVAHDDEDLVLVSGNTYQFVKRYVSGPTTVVRTLRKLVSGTVKVGDGSGEIVSGFSLDLQNGQVTFDSAPTGQATGGCEFDVPVRFGEETDAAMRVAISALDTGNLPEILAIEDVDPVVVSQDYPFGGAKHWGDLAANHTLSELDGRLQVFAPTTTGKRLILPDETGLPLGGPYFRLVNEGSETLRIDDDGGSAVLDPFGFGTDVEIWLGEDSAGATTWYVF